MVSSIVVCWLVVSFYGVSIRFRSFNAELSHFDKSLYAWFGFMAHQPWLFFLMPNPFYTYNQFYFKQFSLVLIKIYLHIIKW